MINCSADFKTQWLKFGRELKSSVTIGSTTYDEDEISSVTPAFECKLLTAAMRSLTVVLLGVDSVDKDASVSATISVKNGNAWEDLTFTGYTVYEQEYDEASDCLTVLCYDGMLQAMKPFDVTLTYPTTVAGLLGAICAACGYTNGTTTFPNSTQAVASDIYDGLGYTYRDVLTEIAQASGRTCVITGSTLYLLPAADSGFSITPADLQGMTFGDHYGPVNCIVLSRQPQEDNVYLQDDASVTANGLTEIKISNNLLVDSARSSFLTAILNELDGLEFDTGELTTYGLPWLDVCDLFTATDLDNVSHTCICLDNSCSVGKGCSGSMQTATPEESKTDYKTAGAADERSLRKTELVVDKQAGEISSKVSITDYNGNEIVSKINQSATTVDISADKINLNGAVTANNNVQILQNGTIKAINADISGKFTMTDGSIRITTSDETSDAINLNYGANSLALTPGGIALSSSIGSYTNRGSYNASSYFLNSNGYQVSANPSDGFALINQNGAGYAYSQYGWGVINLHPTETTSAAPSVNLFPNTTGTNGKTSLDNTGLTFRDSSDNVTAQYPADGLEYINSKATSTATAIRRIYAIPYYTYSNLGVSSSASLETFLKALLKKLCAERPSLDHATFYGLCEPNSASMISVFIYNTSIVDSNGLPQYCKGWYIPLGDTRSFITYGTSNYVWYQNDLQTPIGTSGASYWSSDRNTCALIDSASPPNASSYWPSLYMKTPGGQWTVGRLGENLNFVYTATAQIGSTNNSIRYRIDGNAANTSNIERTILTNETGALKPVHVSGGTTTSFSANTYKYTGVSCTIPAGKYFSITAHAYYSSVSPSAVGFSTSSTTVASGSLQIESLADSTGTRARVTWSAYASSATTLYVWAKANASGNLGIGLDGFYFS